MLPSLLAALLWAPALVGLGALVRWPGDADVRPGVAGLLGLVAAGAIGAALNLALPLGPPVSAAVWLAGVAALVLRRRWILEDARARDLLPLVLLVAAASWLMRAPPFQYDTGYYHQQAIAWTRAGPLRAGIANVHFRLGFNSLWTTAAAVVDLPFAQGKSPFFLNQLPVLFGGQLALVGLRRLVGGDRSFATLMLAAAVLPIASATFGIGGLYVDYTAALYVFAALALWARALEPAGDFAERAMAPALLSVAAPLLKLSAAPLVVAAAVALLLRREALDRRFATIFAAFAAALAVPFLVRGFTTSGCLAFPAWASCFAGVPWTVPEPRTRAAAEAIVSFARIPGIPDVRGWRWLYPWWERVVEDYPEWTFLLGAAGAGAAAWLVARRRGSRAAWFVVATASAGTAFWFLTAPDPRFGLGFLFALGLAPALAVLASVEPILSWRWARAGVAAALVCGAAALAVALDGHERTGTLLGFPPWRPPLLSWPEPPEFEVEPRLVRSGLTVLVPVEGECCGTAPVPCAPAAEVDPGLRFDGYFHVDEPR